MVSKYYHEIRDPIHDFVRLEGGERRVLDSGPVQRLRHVNQLAMSYLIYPGGTHRRFEHSLGVMELAGRVFDVITAADNIHNSPGGLFSELQGDRRNYWRKVLRMAALCHDIGHLPFSHAAEEELLPDNWDHERLTSELIQGDELGAIWENMRPMLNPMDVAKVAVGPEKVRDVSFSNLEILLSQIISGDALGVDRMDYLLRDSHHVGVAYGKFDHYRLVDTISVLPASQQSDEPVLGVESGGLHSAEAPLLARYFMFMQVYHHNVRLAYDYHLQQFPNAWPKDGHFSTDTYEHQRITDSEVLLEVFQAAKRPSAPGHEPASRIVNRRHFRTIYTRTREDKEKYDDPLNAVFAACLKRYCEEAVHKSEYTQQKPPPDFPVLGREGQVESSHAISHVLHQMPLVDVGVILVDPDIKDECLSWLSKNRDVILSSKMGEG